jgi:hypothetical protein
MGRFLNVYRNIILANLYSAVLCLLRELTNVFGQRPLAFSVLVIVVFMKFISRSVAYYSISFLYNCERH